MRLLVTGGAGFIGANFVHSTLRERPQVSITVLDAMTYAGSRESLADVDDEIRMVEGDVADAALVDALVAEADAVVHFAAETHVDRSIAGGREFVHTNVLGTFTLLDAARRHQVPRFLHVGTDEVYGSMKPSEFAHEGSVLEPNSPYAADLLARSFWKTYGYPVVTTRCSNNYGPYQFPEKLIPLMIANGLEGKKLPVYGDGLNERDWIFVEDHCRALDCVLEAGRPGRSTTSATGNRSPTWISSVGCCA